MTGFIYINFWLKGEDLAFFFHYGLLCLSIGLVIPFVNQIISPKVVNSEKATPYECGFEAFNAAQDTLNFQFFIVAVLFIIFDIELLLVLPWILYASYLGFLAFWAVLFFLIILFVGFAFEWSKGALVWVRKVPIAILI